LVYFDREGLRGVSYQVVRVLLLIALLGCAANAQEIKTELNWKPLKELSGTVPAHPGLSVEVYAAEIARRDEGVKLIMRFDFPWGAPRDFVNVPASEFDITSLSRFQARLDFNCSTLTVKAIGGSGEVFQFNGKRHKTKEPPFQIPDGHVFSQYFCEKGEAPTTAPKLTPK